MREIAFLPVTMRENITGVLYENINKEKKDRIRPQQH